VSKVLRTNGHLSVADYVCGSNPERLGKTQIVGSTSALSEIELKGILAELRIILESALEILEPEGTKQERSIR
jgi:hypothetical protein